MTAPAERVWPPKSGAPTLLAMKRAGGLIIVAVCAGALVGCAPASLESMADECGGLSRGIRADESAIMYVPADDPSGTDGLVCLLGKLFSDSADKYAVTLAFDDDFTGKLDVGDFTVSIGELGGAEFVAFAPR